jgi:Tfp pilus assembly protein PilN
MRPVNLIPKEERRGAQRPMRGGPLAYIVLGALLAALAAVTVLVVTDNQISDREAEITTLDTEIAAAETRAAEGAAYTQFHQVAEQRETTVTNLANSRFDWERVMRQLSLVLPGDVWLTNLTGTVKSGVAVEGGASTGLRDGIAGPALQLEGCTTGQESVARFVSALKEIEGVTRVGMQSSTLPASSAEGGETGESVSAGGSCQTRNFIAQFQIVVAFDAAPIPTTGGESGETETVPAPEATPTGTASSEGEATVEGEGG